MIGFLEDDSMGVRGKDDSMGVRGKADVGF